MHLLIEEWLLSICKLDKAAIPDWAASSRFLNFCHTPDEISLACESHCVPPDIKTESGWRALRVAGVLDFSLTGIVVSAITTVLANHAISVFVISTYDTDYILIKEDTLAKSLKALKTAGYAVE